MIYEYNYIITVEIQSETEEEQKELRKKLKQELFQVYGGNEITRLVEMKRV